MNTFYFNTARNALRIFLRENKIKEIYLPYKLCPVIFKACRAENVKMLFYHVDNDFLPVLRKTKIPVLYPNYFGICDKQSEYVAEEFPNLIYDAVQSFYSEPKGIATIYSLRKFFPLTDGAILKTDYSIISKFPQEKYLKPFSTVPDNFDYKSFLYNERRFDTSEEIKTISKQSMTIFEQINKEKDFQKRHENFLILHKYFAPINLLNFNDIPISPLIYPLKTIKKNIAETLIQHNIFLLKYNYFKDIIPIPLNIAPEKITQLFPFLHLS